MTCSAASILRTSLLPLSRSPGPRLSLTPSLSSGTPTLRPHRRLAPCTCAFSTTPSAFSGHSKWAKIKHDKGKNDLKRGAEFSKISREIMTAAKVDGKDSLRLRAALDLAKKAGMPKTRIENAVRKGLGITSDGVEMQNVTIECLGPASVALIVDCLTDNKLRTMQLVKFIIKDNGATFTPTAYLFSRKGRILFSPHPDLTPPNNAITTLFEETFEKAMDIDGVEDVQIVDEAADEEGEGEGIEVMTNPESVTSVSRTLVEGMKGSLKVDKIGVEWVPNEDTMVDEGPGPEWDKLAEFIGELEACDEVSEVYTNVRAARDP